MSVSKELFCEVEIRGDLSLWNKNENKYTAISMENEDDYYYTRNTASNQKANLPLHDLNC